jgi:serine/threonine-protein kinase
MPEFYEVQEEEDTNASSSMIRVVRVCPKCGQKIFSDAPEGLCVRCALRAAMGFGPPQETQETSGKEQGDLTEATREFGDYELLEEVGRGAQGVVVRARQKSLNRIVALKIIGLGQWASRMHLKRFRREAEAAASLEHPGIVAIYEVGERDGSCYFSMKFIEGGQLDEIMRREPMSIRRAAEVTAKVARTVHYAHEHGILHRDIKPGNILLDPKGEPHLTDFGLARLIEADSTVTRTMEVMGTPSYMAPEQAIGNNAVVGAATDVYGIGAVLYQLLTGHPPFAGGTTYETIKLVLDSEPQSPPFWNRKIDKDLSTVCLKCLEKDPKRRYPSALALAEDLERWLKHEPIQARRTWFVGRAKKWVRRNPTSALLAVCVAALVSVVGWIIWERAVSSRALTTGIAVLPFENLNEEKENTAFADGVQDDILTKLAKIADLKVISRTSVMDYRGKRNTREIGGLLRVSHVLEGSVRRVGTRFHMNTQLIDTRTDAHVWAEQYDRDLNDLFAIQGEIAQRIAQQLNVKITAAERVDIERRPTGDLVAFDFYSRATEIFLLKNRPVTDLLQGIDLLNSAVARDPSFFDAYCQLANAHDALYFNGIDRTPARLAMAKAAIDSAFHLRPDSGEAHLAKADHLYRGYLDYDGALAELEIGRQTLPNNMRLFQLMGVIQRRQGHWEESRRNLERAAALDPREVRLLMVLSVDNAKFGRYTEAKQWMTRAVALADPDDAWMKTEPSLWEFHINGNPQPLHEVIESIRATNPSAVPNIARLWLHCALAERDAAAATQALSTIKDNDEISFGDQVLFNREFMEGVIARMTGDEQKAQLAFAAARAEQEKIVQAQPDFGPAWCVLGVIDAGLGRKDDALSEGQRAVELLPIEKDAQFGRFLIKYYAIIAAWVGEKDLACQQFAKLLSRPTFLEYGDLRLLPLWDPLRGDPRFEKIVASLAPNGTNVTR